MQEPLACMLALLRASMQLFPTFRDLGTRDSSTVPRPPNLRQRSPSLEPASTLTFTFT